MWSHYLDMGFTVWLECNNLWKFRLIIKGRQKMAWNTLWQVYNSKRKVRHLQNTCTFPSKVDLQSYPHLLGESFVKPPGPLAYFALYHRWIKTFRFEDSIPLPTVILICSMLSKSWSNAGMYYATEANDGWEKILQGKKWCLWRVDLTFLLLLHSFIWYSKLYFSIATVCLRFW